MGARDTLGRPESGLRWLPQRRAAQSGKNCRASVSNTITPPVIRRISRQTRPWRTACTGGPITSGCGFMTSFHKGGKSRPAASPAPQRWVRSGPGIPTPAGARLDPYNCRAFRSSAQKSPCSLSGLFVRPARRDRIDIGERDAEDGEREDDENKDERTFHGCLPDLAAATLRGPVGRALT